MKWRCSLSTLTTAGGRNSRTTSSSLPSATSESCSALLNRRAESSRSLFASRMSFSSPLGITANENASIGPPVSAPSPSAISSFTCPCPAGGHAPRPNTSKPMIQYIMMIREQGIQHVIIMRRQGPARAQRARAWSGEIGWNRS